MSHFYLQICILKSGVNCYFFWKVQKEMVMDKILSGFKVHLSPYKERTALYGAAALILEEFFALPDLTFPSGLIAGKID